MVIGQVHTRWHEWDLYEVLMTQMPNNNKKERPMSFDKAKPFLTEARYGHTSFATLEEALNAAKQNSAKDFVDSAVYQAINLVKAPIPGDIVVEKINV